MVATASLADGVSGSSSLMVTVLVMTVPSVMSPVAWTTRLTFPLAGGLILPSVHVTTRVFGSYTSPPLTYVTQAGRRSVMTTLGAGSLPVTE